MPRIHITPVVLNLMIINVLIFITLNLMPELQDYFVLHKPNYLELHEEHFQGGHDYYLVHQDDAVYLGPRSDMFRPVQIVTMFFSHTAAWHILMNMMALLFLGPMVEMVLGARRFLIAYLGIGIGSSLLVALFDPSVYPVIGASGALFGMTVVAAAYFPNTRVGLLFLPITFRLKNFVIGAAVLSSALVLVEQLTGQSMGGISHFGHLAGIIAGFLYLRIEHIRKLFRTKK